MASQCVLPKVAERGGGEPSKYLDFIQSKILTKIIQGKIQTKIIQSNILTKIIQGIPNSSKAQFSVKKSSRLKQLARGPGVRHLHLEVVRGVQGDPVS